MYSLVYTLMTAFLAYNKECVFLSVFSFFNTKLTLKTGQTAIVKDFINLMVN